MASFDASGNAFNAANFHNSLLSATRCGLMTADQVQAVWDAFQRAYRCGGSHLQDAVVTWQYLLARVRGATMRFETALALWQTFLSHGALSEDTLALPSASNPIRPSQSPVVSAALMNRDADARLQRAASLPDPGSPIDAGRFVEVCPCCVRSEAKIEKLGDDFVDRYGNNALTLQVSFELGLSSWVTRPNVGDPTHVPECQLEWWECPSEPYGFLRADQWNDVTRVFLHSDGAAEWSTHGSKLKTLCEQGDGKTKVPVRLRDWPSIAAAKNFRRYLNIEIHVKSADTKMICPEPDIVARIRVEQGNDKNGKPSRGRVHVLARGEKYRTLKYENGRWREADLLSGVAAGPR